MRVLVTGGAGYVGSVTAERLVAEGHETIVVDSFMRGHRDAVPPEAVTVEGDSGDQAFMEKVLVDHRIEAVIHCAGRSLAPELVVQPALYFETNVAGGLNLLNAMRAANVGRIVFSSSAAVYGVAPSPIVEDHPPKPINAYGETKRQFEGALDWFTRAYDMSAMSLRYFNVAGASEERGEDHDPETHLIPNMLKAVHWWRTVEGLRHGLRDARRHVHPRLHPRSRSGRRAHRRAEDDGRPFGPAHGLQPGLGQRVLCARDAARGRVDHGREVPHSIAPRREGDPAVLIASNEKAAEVLDWRPRRGTLDEMIGSAWQWHQAHPRGYST